MDEDITIIERYSNRIQRFFNEKVKADFLLTNILEELEMELLNEQKSKPDTSPSRSKFMEEMKKMDITSGLISDETEKRKWLFDQLVFLIDKYKEDKK